MGRRDGSSQGESAGSCCVLESGRPEQCPQKGAHGAGGTVGWAEQEPWGFGGGSASRRPTYQDTGDP